MPSDSHPYASAYHAPVLVDEVLEYLDVQPGGRYVDGTLGGGGHTQAILDASAPEGRVLGIDRDPQALASAGQRLEEYGGRVELHQGNYSEAAEICAAHDFGPVDGFLVDAGVSSYQLDTAERGFSFSRPGPLDMRMGPDAPTVREYLEDVSEEELIRVLRTNGEIRSAGRVARAILEAVAQGKMETTTDLRQVVEATIGGGAGSGRRTTIHPATLVFQGLRIAVNRELEHLERAVQAIPKVVRSGGRAVFISFHSLEDRIIKQTFRELARDCVCPPGLPICGCDARAEVAILTSRPVTASKDEVERNPRARSAKLRAVRVL